MNRLNRIYRWLQSGTLRDIRKETRWIYHHTRAYRKAVICYTLLGLLTTLLGFLSAVFSKHLFDYIIAHRGWYVMQTGFVVFSLGVISILINALVNRYSTKINIRLVNDLRAEVYKVFMNTEWSSLQAYHSGDLLSRLNTDVSTVASSVLGWLPTLLIKGTQFIVSLGVILYFDYSMALIALVAAPLTLLVAKPYLRKMRRYNNELREVNSEVMSFCEETLQNVQPIKAFHLIGVFCEKLDAVQEKYFVRSMEYNRFSVLNSAFLSTASIFSGYLCLGWGAFRLWSGNITFGTMILFIQLAAYLSGSLTALIKLVPTVIESTVSASRLMTVFDLPQENLDDLSRVQKLLEKPCSLQLEGLSFSYLPEHPILSNVNLTVDSGQMIAIIGSSGAGKTTLFRLLLGLLQPTDGTAHLKSESGILSLSPSTRIMFSYVPQDNVIFSGTIADTLRLVRPNATDEQLYAVLRTACAEEFVRRLPKGLYTSLKERGSSLSLGQTQRLAIARAVLSDAPILLLDEVTSALDLKTEMQVLQNLAALPKKTCIISSHRPSVLPLCDRIYRINDHELELQ